MDATQFQPVAMSQLLSFHPCDGAATYSCAGASALNSQHCPPASTGMLAAMPGICAGPYVSTCFDLPGGAIDAASRLQANCFAVATPPSFMTRISFDGSVALVTNIAGSATTPLNNHGAVGVGLFGSTDSTALGGACLCPSTGIARPYYPPFDTASFILNNHNPNERKRARPPSEHSSASVTNFDGNYTKRGRGPVSYSYYHHHPPVAQAEASPNSFQQQQQQLHMYRQQLEHHQQTQRLFLQQQQQHLQQQQQQCCPPLQLLPMGLVNTALPFNMRTPSPIEHVPVIPPLPLLASPEETVKDVLSSSFKWLGFQQPSTLKLALHCFGRLDTLPSLASAMLHSRVRFGVVLLWLAAKLEERRSGLAGAVKVAVAIGSTVGDVNAMELEMLHLLDWSPYRGFQEEDEILILL